MLRDATTSAKLNIGTQAREHDAAPTVVEALMYSLRTRGLPALQEPDTQRRIAALSPSQVRQVIGRLGRAKEKYLAITDSLIAALDEVLR
jgi:hypothetical protein